MSTGLYTTPSTADAAVNGPGATAPDIPASPTGTAAETAYTAIKADVLLGSFPLGVRLREERIAERLGMSRTPVREALLRLLAERFLERHAEGGLRVATPTKRHLRELYEVRRALESFAITRTLRSPADTHDLPELYDEWSALRRDVPARDAEFVLVDEDFHRRLAEAAGNQLLVEELRIVCERIRPVRSQDFMVSGRVAATVSEHLAILDALLRGDAAAAGLLDRHIVRSQQVVESAVGRVIERMLTRGDESAW